MTILRWTLPKGGNMARTVLTMTMLTRRTKYRAIITMAWIDTTQWDERHYPFELIEQPSALAVRQGALIVVERQ